MFVNYRNKHYEVTHGIETSYITMVIVINTHPPWTGVIAKIFIQLVPVDMP